MAGSRAELMTVREMIDAAIDFDKKDPVVDFKMLESVLYVIGGQLNVLERHVAIQRSRWRAAQAKKRKKEKKIKVTQLKIHSKGATTTTDTATEKSDSKKPKKKKSRSRSRSMDQSGRKRKFKEERVDVFHEKLLVVSRTDTAAGPSTHESERDLSSSIVTQEQYDRMVAKVRKLQAKFGVIPNVETTWSNLHKTTSITDPKAALNMATRLEVSHKKLNEMLVVITKFASSIPGIDLKGSFDEIFIHKSRKTSEETLKPSSTKSESVLVDTVNFPEEEIDLENMATWSELDVSMENMRNNNIRRLSEAATNATETARRASSLFKMSAPKLAEAGLINVKFARLRVQVDRFTNKANAFDATMASQMSLCQENVTQMQYDVETIKERIDDHLAHPAEDPAAVAAIKEEFADMLVNLLAANKNQMALTGVHAETAADLTRIKTRLEMIGRVKTTREEAIEALKNKARVVDVNGMLSREQLFAVVGFLQGEIHKTKDHIESGESNWQVCIDDFIATNINGKCDRVQALTLNHSLRNYYRSINAELSTMLNIVGDFPVNLFKKKMDREGNCLSCGTPADIKVPDEYMELARRMIRRQVAKIDDEYDEIPPKPCVPGRPIPHPVDMRASVCDRYCGASVNKTEETLSSSLLGLDVADINPTHMIEMRRKVHMPCTPCTHSEETFF